MFSWDPEKDHANRAKHGAGFEAFAQFALADAEFFDIQFIERAERELWTGPIGDTLHAAVITERGSETRLMSLRRATRRESGLCRGNRSRQPLVLSTMMCWPRSSLHHPANGA